MSESAVGPARDDRTLRRVAGVLAVVVAGLHAYTVLPDMARQIFYWQFPDPRPVTFLLATMAILMGIVLVIQGFDPLPIYVGGIALMLAFVLGYLAWHTTLGHGAFWPGRQAVEHDVSQLYVVYLHLVHNHVELASKVGEVALLAVLSVLSVREYRARSE